MKTNELTRNEWESQVLALEPAMRESIESAVYDADYDEGATPDDVVIDWRRRKASGKADRRNGC